ncbi:fibronectin type III domain-containing protein [Flavobacterium sp. SM2513]|uniref:fibronectin type III domain-containing protein n=1 Tax=Flavobacterium sp. SM2513 TaxID=3424766 RepID=UPI003D7F8126
MKKSYNQNSANRSLILRRKGKEHWLGWLTFCMALIGLNYSAQAQLAIKYTFEASNGTYSSISSTGTSILAMAADNNQQNLTGLPGFTVNGTAYTNARVSSNGWLILYGATAPTNTTESTILSTAATNGSVIFAPMNADLHISTIGSTGFYYQTIGNENIFEWTDYSRYSSGGGGDVLNFQIRMNTVTGAVSYVYGTCTQGSGLTSSFQIGWKTNGTTSSNWATDINNLMIDATGSSNSCTWQNAVTGNSNTSTMYFNTANPTVKPSSGLTYTWTSQAVVNPVRTFASVSIITDNGATLSWTAPTGATQYNVRYRAVGSCSWTNWSGNPANTNTAILTGLNDSTNYQIQVQASDGVNNSIWSHIPSSSSGAGTNGYVVAGTFKTLIPSCAGTPLAGTISGATVRPTCGGATPSPSTVTVTGQSVSGPGITYQWEKSTDNLTWANATGTGNASVTYTLPAHIAAQTEYYRLKVMCANSSEFAYSNVLQVTDPVAPTTFATNVTTSVLQNITATVTWTNGNGTRRFVKINTTNNFIDPVDAPGPALTANTAYAGSGEQIIFDGTGTSVAVTGLSPSTTYYVRVYEYMRCGSTAPFSYLYQADTEDDGLGSFITTNQYCTPSSTGTATYINEFSTSLGTTNISNLASGYTTGGYQDNTATTAVTSFATGGFNFNLAVAGGTLGAAIWIDWNNNKTFETSERVFVTTGYGDGPYSGTITVPGGTATGDYRMRVMVDFNSSAPSNPCMTANLRTETEDYKVVVAAIPSCLAPTALASSNIASTTATLSWTASASTPTNGYDVYYNTTNTAPTTGTAPTINNHAASPYNATGLTASTTYYWWVRSDCGDTSTWATGGSFVTPCASIATFPFVESFDATSTTLACWGVSAGAGATYNWEVTTADATNGAATPASTARFAFLNVYNAQTTYNTYNIFTPTFELDATAKRLTYNYFLGSGGYTTTPIPLSVFISVNGGAFTSIYGHTTANSTFATATGSPWQLNVIDLSTYVGQTIQLAFVSNSNYGSGITNQGIDQVTIENIPSCLAPTALASSAITTTTATLSWTASASTPANGYDIYYSTTNTAPLAGTTPTADNHTASPLNATGLAESSTYYWWVRSDCGVETSTWASGGSFNTITPPPTNENCAGAIALVCNATAATYSSVGSTAVAPAGCTIASKGIWFSFVGTSGDITINSTASFDHKMSIQTGSCAELTWIDCKDGSLGAETYTIENSVLGQTYYVYVAHYSSSSTTTGNITISIVCEAVCPTGVWVGTTSTAWSTASNWADNMVPETCTAVTVNNAAPMTISSDVTVASLTLGATANVTVNGTLNVGNISVATGGMMTVANNAVLLQTALATNSGMVTVKRNSSDLFRQDYTLWSSPVTGQNLRAFSTQTLFNRFSSYDNTIGANGDYVQEIITTADVTNKTFTNAKGYLIRMPNNWVEVASSNPAMPYLGSFTGVLNNGAVSIALSGANNKLNLVGNPYASPISIAAFFAANTNLDQTLYFWRKKASATPGNTASGYATYNTMGFVSADTDINGVVPTNIQTGQGFFVVANSAAPGNLVFNNTMRNNGAATFYKGATETPAELHRMWLNLSNATTVVGQTLIAYATGATQGVDAGIDAVYFNDSDLALTTLINNAEYIIQGRSLPFVNTDIVPLGFKSDVAGSFTISLSNFDGLFVENQDIFLKDNVTGTVQNLKLAAYTFATPVGVYNTRFEVQYTNSTLGTNNPLLADQTILIGVKDQKIKINAGSVIMDKIELIDVAGRVIYTQDGVNATTATLENVVSANQMLIVRISTAANGVVNQKIIF